jgi:acyl-CoA synthetase (AMP-forming)/AMP-acid ligase II
LLRSRTVSGAIQQGCARVFDPKKDGASRLVRSSARELEGGLDWPPSINVDEVIACCRSKIASFKIPRHVVFVDAFPMTETGKIRKSELRADAKQQFVGLQQVPME